tara:strand:+ start:607 stop:1302 length:696 start_codon:yes stop_codon:yes gene_type:complete
MPIQQMLLGTPSTSGDGVGPSVSFDGSNDYLSIPDNSVFSLGTDDFTIETFYKAASGYSDYDCLVSFGWKFQLYLEEGAFKFWAEGTSSYFIQGTFANTGSNSVSEDTWYHVAVTRSGNVFRLFLDGVQKYSTTSSSSFGDPTGVASIGSFRGISYYADGLMSNFRFTKGQALYTSNFTKPSAPLTTTSQGATASNVKLLCCNTSGNPAGSTVTPDTITNNGATASSGGPF